MVSIPYNRLPSVLISAMEMTWEGECNSILGPALDGTVSVDCDQVYLLHEF